MQKARLTLFSVIFSLLAATLISASTATAEQASGRIEKGYRILPIDQPTGTVRLTVYRGDYIKFAIPDAMADALLKIPALGVEQRLPVDIDSAPYFKMKSAGTVHFSIDAVSGEITVVDYREAHYSEVDAEEAAELIATIHPLVLDVRTPAEYQRGHLENAVLIPVQELQSRWQELEKYKNQDILLYCATGNRSTVGAKILIDAGFQRITNMRHGIAEWAGKNYPVVD
jgi:rhodanese-related sulfurtransferase